MTNREGTPSSLSKRSSSTVEQKLYLTLYKLSKLSCSQIFLYPVPTSAYPDYTQLIKTPMDISTILDKLKQSKYRYISEIYSDLMLICKNSFSYHRGRQSQKRMKEAVAKFVKSVDHAWNLLRKSIEELNKRQEAELIRGDELTKLIKNIELMIKKSYEKKIEKLTSFMVVIKEGTSRNAVMQEDKTNSQTNKYNEDKMKSQFNQDEQKEKKQGILLQPYQCNNQFISDEAGQNNNENKVIPKSKASSDYRQQSQQISETDQLSYVPKQENAIPADKEKEELREQNRKQAIGQNEESVTLSLNKKSDSNNKNCDKQQERVGKNSSDIDAGLICQDFNKLVKQKLKKYKALLLYYLNWIQKNIFEVQPINKCDEHQQQSQKQKPNEITINQEQEEASQFLCYDCIQYEKERDMYNQLKGMLTFRYLQMFLAREKKEVEKGQINLKRLLKFLKELNLWLKLLTSPYINWRRKQKFVQIERNLIKCFEKMIQYKKLGPQFSNQIEKIKNANKEGQQNDCKVVGKQGVRTRSKKRVVNQSHSQPDFIRKYKLNKRKQIKQLNLTNRYNIVDTLLDMKEGQENQNEIVQSKDEQYQQFLSLIEQDQIYNSFKVVIVRDKEDPHSLIVKNKKQQIQKRRINRKKRQKKMKKCLKDRAQYNKQEDSILQQTDQDEYQPPILQRLIKQHKNKRRCSIRQQIDEQDVRKQRLEQQRKEDEELIYNYSLKSNILVIEKYRERLQLDWNRKWQEIFGAVPDKIEFQNVTADQSLIIQS